MEKGKSGEGGKEGGGDGGVSIQLPRISSARGDSPPRICHLRGRDCQRIYGAPFPEILRQYIPEQRDDSLIQRHRFVLDRRCFDVFGLVVVAVERLASFGEGM